MVDSTAPGIYVESRGADFGNWARVTLIISPSRCSRNVRWSVRLKWVSLAIQTNGHGAYLYLRYTIL